MSKFIAGELETIDCGDGEWIKIPKEISVEDGLKTHEAASQDKPLAVAAFFIREWNFKDHNGLVPNITEETIKKLDINTFTFIMGKIMEKITLDKKKLQKLKGQSEDMAET